MVALCNRETIYIFVFIVMVSVIYGLRHGLHTLTAVPILTQPSTLRVALKWVSAFVLSNNKWRWWMWIVAASILAVQVVPGWSTLSKGRLLLDTRCAFITSARCDDSTVNVLLVICRPHHITTYIDAAYCWAAAWSVSLSVCLSWSWAVQKLLNRLRCRLRYGLRVPRGTVY